MNRKEKCGIKHEVMQPFVLNDRNKKCNAECQENTLMGHFSCASVWCTFTKYCYDATVMQRVTEEQKCDEYKTIKSQK